MPPWANNTLWVIVAVLAILALLIYVVPRLS
jgi:hypothetical protein